ncbi:DEAD/DEAH box helicase family protein [Candidatus Kaiserbacteria bacterium]|nr:DEAD/DEAH box helicase family protein [Candidatus Kaiserbacteria bacterium]
MLKDYQVDVVNKVKDFFDTLDTKRATFENLPNDIKASLGTDYLSFAFTGTPYAQFADRPRSGAGALYPRVCIKMPTGGGKTLIAIETIRAYQNIFAKRKTGLVVWITHREQIYRQTIENLQNKSHIYRQLLDQASGNRTIILEKGQPIREQDVRENLVVLMLMIQSAARDTNKIFEDSGGYTDFFPTDNRYDLHKKLIEAVPNLDKTPESLWDQMQVKTSLGNVVRTLSPLIIVDEFHTMFTDNARATLDGLNPSVIVGLSATPKREMNLLVNITGQQLKAAEMIKLDMHLFAPTQNGDWRGMLAGIKQKRDQLERKARKLEQNQGAYIRPIALIQVERTGRDQRGRGLVHSEDVREHLVSLGVPRHEIAVKSSSLDEIKQQKLLSKESEVRYIITREALKEGWDCSFAYILGVIPNARNNSSMTQLVGRVLRQPYAKKTGVAELDESYIYFASGHTQEALERVKKGFDEEGLGDVSGGIQTLDKRGQVVSAPRVVRIKKDILKDYPESLFLPVWLMKQGTTYRRFVYEVDIKPAIRWQDVVLEDWMSHIMPSIGTTRRRQTEVIVGLEPETTARQSEVDEATTFDVLYLARRLYETIENAFIAYDMAAQVVAALSGQVSQEWLDRDAGYIARELEMHLLTHRKTAENTIFSELMESGQLCLAVSDDDDLGFTMPRTDVVENNIRSAYGLTLYEDVDVGSLNLLEREVARIIEASPKVLWWARNKVAREWYAIQGWQRGKVRPDFIIARKDKNDELEFVYVVESKGEHLIGNADTQYKDEVFERMNNMRGKIKKLLFRTTTVRLNDRFEFELLPQNEEELRLRTKLNA